jgi:hypothetical protein
MFTTDSDPERQLRVLEAIALLSSAAALVVTKAALDAGVATEANTVTATLFGTIGWYPTAAVAIGTLGGIFALYRRIIDDYPQTILSGATAIAAVSVGDIAWNLGLVAQHGGASGEVPVEFAAVVAIATAAVVVRPAVDVARVELPTAGQVRAIAFAFVLVTSLVAMPFAGSGVASADTSEPSAMNLATADTVNETEEWNDSIPDSSNGVFAPNFTSDVFVVDNYDGSSDYIRRYHANGSLKYEQTPGVNRDYDVGNGMIFTIDGNDNLVAYDAADPVGSTTHWSNSITDITYFDFIEYSESHNIVYYGVGNGDGVTAVDADTGNELWTKPYPNSDPAIAGPDSAGINQETGNLFVITDTGPEYVAKYSDSGRTTTHQFDGDDANSDNWFTEVDPNGAVLATVDGGYGSIHRMPLDLSSDEMYDNPASSSWGPSHYDSETEQFYLSYDGSTHEYDTSTMTTGDNVGVHSKEMSFNGSDARSFETTSTTLTTYSTFPREISDPLNGTAVDSSGNPLPENTTITAWGPTEAAFNTSDAEELERKAEQLKDELSNPLPQSWRDFSDKYRTGNGLLDADKFTSGIDGTYPLVHKPDDWSKGRTGAIKSEVDAPRTTVSPDKDVIISLWDASEEPTGVLANEGPVDSSHHGQLTSGTVVIEQLSPTDGVTNRRTIETRTVFESNTFRDWGGTEYPAVRTQLPEGVYRVYPEGNQATGYVFTVGSPNTLATGFTEDLRTEANQLDERAQRIRDLLADDRVIQRTTTTDANGRFSIDVPSNTISVQIHAMRGNGEILQDLQDPSLDDLREARVSGGYNGSVILPSPSPKSVTPPASNVTVTGYRSPTVPFSNMSSFADLQAFLEQQRLNNTVTDLRSEYDERFEEMERSNLERIYSDHRTLVETVPGAESRYLDRSDFEQIQAAEDLSNDQLSQETTHMQIALANVGRIEPPDPEDPINVSDGEINLEYPLPDSVDPDTVSVERHWSNGSVQPTAEEYWSVESTGIAGQNQALVIDGLPIDDSDPAAFDIRVQAAGTDDSLLGNGNSGLLDYRITGLNPAAAGAAPDIGAVDFSNLAPGPSERVYVSIDAGEDSGYDGLVDAQAWNDDGESINATVDENGSKARFTTDGEGTHTVRLVYENQQGDQYTLTERVDAKPQSRSDPATVRASGDPDSMTGIYAVTGDKLDGAQIETNGGTMTVDVLAEDSEGPGELNIHPSNVMDGDRHSIEVNVLHGSDEQRVSGNIPVNLHLENTQETTIYWRSSAGFGGDPITHEGETRHGSVDKPNDEKHVVRTYTEPDGSLTVTTVESAGPWQRSMHRAARYVGGITSFFGFLSPLGSLPASGGAAGLLGLGGFAVKRRRSGA